MAEISDDAYLLEVMASHAALAFRPDTPKVNCRCKCEEQVGALIGAFNDLTEAFGKEDNHVKKPHVEAGALAFGAGAAMGAAITFLIRKRL